VPLAHSTAPNVVPHEAPNLITCMSDGDLTHIAINHTKAKLTVTL
jgi:hypothetical protein